MAFRSLVQDLPQIIVQLVVITTSKELKSCNDKINNSVIIASVVISFIYAIISVIFALYDFFNRQQAFLVIVSQRYHENNLEKIEQHDPFIVDEAGIILATTNQYLREWWLDGVKFIGNNDDWSSAHEIFM